MRDSRGDVPAATSGQEQHTGNHSHTCASWSTIPMNPARLGMILRRGTWEPAVVRATLALSPPRVLREEPQRQNDGNVLRSRGPQVHRHLRFPSRTSISSRLLTCSRVVNVTARMNGDATEDTHCVP